MENGLLLLLLAAFPLMGSPGPATISLAAVGTAYGVRKGMRYLGGIIFGTGCVLMIVSAGISIAVKTDPLFVTILTGAAVAYILYLAWKIATAPTSIEKMADVKGPSFSSGLFLALANPKAFAAIGAVFAGHTVIEGNPFWDTLMKLAALGAVIIVVNGAWLCFGSSFSTLLSGPRTGRVANFTFAIMLIVSVVISLAL